ncbi:hypothetical protein GCM10020331_026210 [Ectobacillus funiculus]
MVPEGLQNEELKQEIAAYREEFKKNSNQKNLLPTTLSQCSLSAFLEEVREVLPKDAYITTDVGWNKKTGWDSSSRFMKQAAFLTPGGFATMGFGAPAALGAKKLRSRIK